MVPVLAVGKLVRSNRVCSAVDDATSLGVEHSKQALVRSRQLAGRLELVDSRLVLEPGHSKRVLEVGKQEHKLVRKLISFCKTNRR